MWGFLSQRGRTETFANAFLFLPAKNAIRFMTEYLIDILELLNWIGND
jgi:hypothetical protein